MRISIVTPCLNAQAHIAETIRSVVQQRGDFSIEYIVVDGGSSDATEQRVREAAQCLVACPGLVQCDGVTIDWVSEPGSGMYEALNRGFDLASGDVYAWINADDLYLPGAFQAVSRVFSQCPAVDWLKGVTSYIDEDSVFLRAGKVHLYDRGWLHAGVYGRDLYFVQQDSVFWRAALWASAGHFPSTLCLAGDYWLWSRFAEFAPLYSLPVPLSCFRRRSGQLSENRSGYVDEVRCLKPGRLRRATIVRRLLGLPTSRYARPLRLALRWLVGNQTYHAVVFDDDGCCRTLAGDYVRVRTAL